jgi:hypothetical protein
MAFGFAARAGVATSSDLGVVSLVTGFLGMEIKAHYKRRALHFREETFYWPDKPVKMRVEIAL